MVDGQKITFSGEGDQEPGLEAGDIIIVLDEKEHPVFKYGEYCFSSLLQLLTTVNFEPFGLCRRSGDNLVLRMELSLVEALCGFQRSIRTLDERELVISALPGQVFKQGDLKCILNEGMPQYRNPFEKGRLIIQFSVDFPRQLPTEIIPKLESLLPPK